jgi:hypothetical protein
MKKPVHVRARTLKAAAVIALAIACGSLAATTKAATVIGSCSWLSLSRPFLPWADASQYFLAPGGGFEGGMSGWALAGGTQVVTGNESYKVGGSSNSMSLSLPTTSSSVTTPTMCVTVLSPTFRMLIRNNGNNGYTDGQLAVYLNFTGADGKIQHVKIAALKGKTSWAPTLPISFIQYISTPLQSGTAQISFTIKPNDNHGNWQIDDLYVDPLKSY